MEKINSEEEVSKVSPLEETLLKLQEKISQQVQAHLEVTTPLIEPEIPVYSPVVEVVEEPVIEENNFEDFVGKLKDILATPKEVKVYNPVKSITVPVKEEAPIAKSEPAIATNYVQELEKQTTPKPESPTNNYVVELDKISSKVAGVVEPDKVQDIKKLLEEYMEKYLKKAAVMAEYAGGGGSVAQQFANGGTMNGTLNVTNGQILSGGVDIATYFGGGGGGSQTLSFDSNTANLSISNGNTVSLSALSATSGSGSNVSGLSGNWQSTYTTVSTNSANWNTAYTLATGLTSLSSNWQSTYTTVSANSANWNSAYSSTTALNLSSSYWNNAYTLVQGNSASWNNALSAYSFIANGSTSIFKLSSTAPFTNAAGYIVAMNGAIQTPNTDFTITYSGTNYLDLNFTPRLGALITVQVLGNGVITNSSVVTVSSSTYNPLYAYVNSNFSVNVPTGSYAVDTTTSGVTATLPTTPTFGTTISFMDPYYTWATKNFVLSASVNIQNQNQPVAMSIAGYSFKAVYVGGTYGWRFIQ